jgi:hypothetical protein
MEQAVSQTFVVVAQKKDTSRFSPWRWVFLSVCGNKYNCHSKDHKQKVFFFSTWDEEEHSSSTSLAGPEPKVFIITIFMN